MKILIYGLAKSGTTILAEKVRVSLSDFLGVEVKTAFEPKGFSLEDGKLVYLKKNGIQSSEENEVVKTLFDSGVPSEQLAHYEDSFDKKIFIIRDPRDRYISQVFYRWYAGHNPNETQFQHTLALCKLKQLNPDSVPFVFLANRSPGQFQVLRNKLINSYGPVSEFINSRNNDWHILRYEDLIDENLGNLEDYLGFKIKADVSVTRAHRRVARSKAYGNWRRWYTKEDVGFLKPAFTPFMNSVGYDVHDWELERVTSLPSAEGSAYMERLFRNTYSGKRSQFKVVNLNSIFQKSISWLLGSKLRYRFFPKIAPSDPCLFLHIPKTGGSSFRQSLKQMVGLDNVIEDNPNKEDYMKSSVYKYMRDDNFVGLNRFLSSKRNAWVAGHVTFEKYLDFVPPERTFTFVRHPVDRVVSAYKHKTRHKGVRVSLEEFVLETKMHDAQSKFIPLDFARRMAFVGVTDRYSECIGYLNKKFNWSLVETKRQVSPRGQDLLISDKIRDLILQRNQKDLELYEFAVDSIKEHLS
ncbi:sulfotransferase family 2 domain-containing protein [Microbulbifer agarilyticus]